MTGYGDLTREFGQRRVARACVALAGENVGTRADMLDRLRMAIENQDETSDSSTKGAGSRLLHATPQSAEPSRSTSPVPFVESFVDRIAEASTLPARMAFESRQISLPGPQSGTTRGRAKGSRLRRFDQRNTTPGTEKEKLSMEATSTEPTSTEPTKESIIREIRTIYQSLHVEGPYVIGSGRAMDSLREAVASTNGTSVALMDSAVKRIGDLADGIVFLGKFVKVGDESLKQRVLSHAMRLGHLALIDWPKAA